MYVKFEEGERIWLFRQSSYGGERHILVNTEEFTREEVFYAETECGKRLKSNPAYSEGGPFVGRSIRNGCDICFQERGWEAKKRRLAEEQQVREERGYEDDLPF